MPGLLLSILSGNAAKFALLTVEQLADQADLVVHGRVESVEVRRDGGGRIFTLAEMDVSEVWKGDLPGPKCRVVSAGGVLGHEDLTVDGQPRYRVGEELVVFLVRNPAGENVVLGLAHGHFQVQRDAATGKGWVRNLFHGGPADRSTQPAWEVGKTGVTAEARLSLDELRARVKEVVR